MVLEHLYPTRRIERTPSITAVLAFIFVGFAVAISYFFYPSGGLYPGASGLFIVTLIVMPAIPFFLHELVMEERKEESAKSRKQSSKSGRLWFFDLYYNIIELYGFFFIGAVLGFAFFSSMLPVNISNVVFYDLRSFLPQQAGYATNPSHFSTFQSLFLHNLEVLMLMLVFSLLYSIGSIFLLVLNAAVVGVFLEQFIRAQLPNFAGYGFFAFPLAFAAGSLQGILGILPHGIFEFLAFFLGSIAGGTFSVAIERRIYKRKALRSIFFDVVKILFVAVALLAIGAAIESSY